MAEREGSSDVKLSIWQFLDDWGINLAHLLAGLLAGVAVMRDRKHKKKSFFEKVFVVFIAMISANYLTPVIIEWTNASEDIENGIAFIVGFTGLEMLNFVIDIVKSKLKRFDE